MTLQLQSNVRIIGETSAKYQKILTPAALEFVVDLDRKFRETRNEILARRHQRQRRLDAGEKPRFLLETAHIRLDESWSVSPNPADLQ
ncbi:MAG: malate synthase A, partial [Nitrososphaerota archaeon]|nr:malate synthase A [Nitrososphaerota archaeon]